MRKLGGTKICMAGKKGETEKQLERIRRDTQRHKVEERKNQRSEKDCFL